MKIRIILKDHPYGNRILLDGHDVTSAVYRVSFDVNADSRIPEVTLGLKGDVEVEADGSRVLLEYPHEVKKFFKGKRYEDVVKDVVKE